MQEFSLRDYLARLASAATEKSLSDVLVGEMTALGAAAVVGHALPFGGSARVKRWKPIISTFPEEMNEAYAEHGLNDDPFMEAALAYGAPIRYQQVADDFYWTEDQKALFLKMKALGYADGVASPVMTRPGVTAYFAAAFPKVRHDLGPVELRHIYILFNEFYSRHREMTQKDRATFSARERQILVAMAKGKSNADIGAQLGISGHTVDTYVRRCFEKLGVNSRLEATIKCFGLGLQLEDGPLDPPSAPRLN